MSTLCEICDNELVMRWTDTHGVGVCCTCGAPHQVYHYDPETKERLNKSPALALNELGAALAKRYWSEKRRMVFPGSYDMGFTSRRDTTYSGATLDDEREFYDWLETRPDTKAAQSGVLSGTQQEGQSNG